MRSMTGINMKKGIALLMAAALMLTGCGSSSASTSTQAPAETVKETQTEAASDTLVIYFSRTGEQYTVFENNDFSGKTLIPFSTHEGSGLSGFDKKLQSACAGATVGKGLAVRGNDAQNDQEKVRGSVSSWLSELGF